MTDERGNQITMFKWSELFSSRENNANYFEFTNKVMKIVQNIIHGVEPPRIFLKILKHLQMTPKTQIGDFFLFEEYALIIIYGFDYYPYQLPTFLTPRVFSMEYSLQKFRVDERHFNHYRHHQTFTLPQEIGHLQMKK